MKRRGRLILLLCLGTLLTLAFSIDAYKSRLNTDLIIAVAQYNFPQVRSLLDRGANPNVLATQAEWDAYNEGHPEVLFGYTAWERITRPFYDLSHPQNHCLPLLRFATLFPDPGVAIALVKHGANVNRTGYNNETPLMGACYRGHTDLVQLLLTFGAQVNARDDRDGLALISALKGKQWHRHEDPTPLPLATRRAIVELLLRAGADVNAKTSDGHTPLQIYRPAEGKRDPLVALLVQHGAVWPETVSKSFRRD